MPNSVAGAGPIRVGLQLNTPPFSYAPAPGAPPVGFSVDLARLVFARLRGGPRPEVVEVTSTTREHLLAEHRIDIECGSTTITEARLRRHAFSRPIFRTSHRIAVKAGVRPSSPATLRVVGIRDSTSHAALAGWSDCFFDYDFSGAASIGAARDAFLQDDSIDAIVADEIILKALIGGDAGTGVTLLDAKLGAESYGFMMRREDTDFVDAVDAALADVLDSAEYPALLAAWFVDELPGLGYALAMSLDDDAFVRGSSDATRRRP